MSTDGTSVRAEDFMPPARLDKLRNLALMVGIVGAAVTVAGFFSSREHFYQSYLVGYLYWLVIAIGCLGWSMIQHLTAGTWGLVMRRTFEAASRTLPLLIVLAIPFYFGMEILFPWARPEAVNDELIQKKALYLDVNFFWIRTALYFAIWCFMAYFLSAQSKKQDETGAASSTIKMRMLSGPGIVVLVLVSTFASWDWLMSLDPHWFSSLYGFWFVSSTALASLLFVTVMAWYLNQSAPMKGVFLTKHFHDYGKLTLALVMFWAYMTLSQFLITWAGNIPEFTTWYVHRNHGSWKAYTVFLVVFHFFVPFAILLSASLKKQPRRLVVVAFWMLFMRWVDLYWQAAPNFIDHFDPTRLWLDAAALVGVGGIWMWFFVGELKKRTLIPVNDPYLPEVIGHG